MDKRTFLKTSLIAGTGAIFSGKLIAGISNADSLFETHEFTQNKLNYAYNALEPHIDAQTMELHYSKHHAGYTRKFNAAVKEEGLQGKNLNDIFASVSKYSSAVRNNGGGFYNHNLYWSVMSPDGGKDPQGNLAKRITKDFGSLDKFKTEFSTAAATVFGSGWAWLIEQNGKLKITQTANQDNPLMDVAAEKGTPLLTIDVWEHAYYLNYQNRRSDYIDAFWKVVNWKEVEKIYSAL